MAEVHPAMASTTVTNLGQVELDLEITGTGNGNKGAATGNGTRKKSSSALQAEEEEGGSGKKTSKSSDDSELVRVTELRDAHARAQSGCSLMNINPEEAALVTTEATDQPPEALACKDNTGEYKLLSDLKLLGSNPYKIIWHNNLSCLTSTSLLN